MSCGISKLHGLTWLGAMLMTASAFAATPANDPSDSAKAPFGSTTIAPSSRSPVLLTGISYDRKSDLITIAVEQQPLSEVLRNVGHQTGIDMRMDPQADAQVTLDINRVPLDTALDSLGRLNVIKQYKTAGKGKEKKNLLVRVTVLPQGKTNIGDAVRLQDADKEVDARAIAMSAAMKAMLRQHEKQEDLMMQRWKSRMGDLTAKQKQHYDDLMRQIAERDAKHAQQRAQADTLREQRHEERINQLPNPDAQARARQGHPATDPDPVMAAKASQDFPLDKTPAVIYPNQGK